MNRPALLWSVSGKLLSANPLFAQVCGLDAPPEGQVWPDLPNRTKLFKAVRASGETNLVTQFTVTADDGQDIAVQCQLRPILEDGQLVAVLGMCETDNSHLHGNALGQERSRNFSAATETAHIIAFTMDPKTGEMTLSNSFSTLIGLKMKGPQDCLKSLSEWAHPDDYKRAKPWLDALISGDIRRFNGDIRLYCADVGWVWSNVKAQMRDRSALGLPPIICGCAVDVSEYKRNADRLEDAYQQAEEARRAELAMRHEAKQTQKLLSIAVSNGQIGPFTLCPATGEGWMMDETCLMMGYAPGSLSASIDDRMKLMHPDDVESARSAVADLISGKIENYRQITRQRHADGRYHWYRTIASLVDRSEDGLPPLIAGVTTNIDHIKENEAKLASALEDARTSRDRLNRLADNAPVALYEILLSRDGSISMTYFSAKMPQLFGIKEAELRKDAEAAIKAIHPDDLPKLMHHVETAHKTLTPFSVELRVMHPSEGLKWVQIASNPTRLPDGQTLSYASVTDVTERKTAEARAAEAAAQAQETHLRLNRLTDNAPAALYEFRLEPDGYKHIPYFSAKLPELLGATARELSSDIQAFFRNVLPEDLARFRKIVDAALAENTAYCVDFRVQHPEHGLRWLQLSSVPKNRSGKGIHHYASLADITAIREAEQRSQDALRESKSAHDRLNRLAENTTVGLFELYQPAGGTPRFVYCNAQQAQLNGVSQQDLYEDASDRLPLVHPEDRPAILEARELSLTRREPVEVHYRVQHPERGELSLISRYVPHRDQSGGVIWYGSTVDLTERLEMERRAAAAAREAENSHARLASLADAAPVGLYETMPAGSDPMQYVYTSARFDEMLGLEAVPEKEKFAAAVSRLHPDDLDKIMQDGRQPMIVNEGIAMRLRFMHPERGQRWMSVSAVTKPSDTGASAHVGAIIDITKDVEAEAKLRQAHELAERMRMENEIQALHDPLTGLPNRRSFDQQLADRFAAVAADPTQRGIGLVRIDGDRFKYINDTFGHEAGDAVLCRIADVMRLETRFDDFPARVGGDEFTILLPQGADDDHARALVERIQTKLEEPMFFKGRPCVIQASFGIACIDGSQEAATDLLAFADAALYRAKEKGRNRMEFFTPALRHDITRTRRLASELQDALNGDAFEPFFQPQVDIATGKLFGVEVLMRWRHPENGVMAPDDFLGVADQLRIVPDLDRIMMRKTHAFLRDLRTRGLHVPKVSFNVSSGRMLDEDLISSAKALLDDGVKLTVELLESTLVEDEGEVFNFHLDLLRDMGIELEIDDFGSGHASIIALMAVAPAALKIDRRLIAPVADDHRARKLVRAIIEIAETLEINTIAEGVEEEAQVDVLRDLGCNVVQGYLFARPLDGAGFENWLRQGAWLNAKTG